MILTKQFLIDSIDKRVFHYNAGTSRPHMFNILRGVAIYHAIFIRDFTSFCFLKKIELLTFLLSVVSYLFFSFGGACRNASTVLSLSLPICCIEQSPADGSIFSLQ